MEVPIKIRNASIRRQAGLHRADWRFLLPSVDGVFQHMVLLGGPVDMPEWIIDIGIALRVSLTLPKKRSADAVIVLSDAGQIALNDVADCLVPGGALYYEVDRRSPGRAAITPGRLQRRLQNVGLLLTGLYWVAPDFVTTKRYIPLDAPEAFQWYLSTLYFAGTPLYRLLEIGIRLYLGRHNGRFTSIAPCYAVTAINGANNHAAPSVLAHPGLPAELQIPGLRPVVLTSGQDDGSRTVILPFAPKCRQPSAVFKISTLPNFNENTEHEQAILNEIRSRLNGSICRTIPQPLGLFRYGNLTVGIESFAAGRPLFVSSGRWRASFQEQFDDLEIAANWLSKFHLQAQVDRLLWNDDALERWIETPLKNYARIFGLTSSEEKLFAEVRKHAEVLRGASLPLVWMHNDFGPWNLHRNGQDFTVIDWEFGIDGEKDRYGPSLYDLLYFVTYWFHAVRRLNNEAAELRGFYKLFVEPDYSDKHCNAVHRIITEYMAALDIDRRFLPLMLVYLWINQALHQFDRQQALGKIQANARVDNSCIKYIAVLAEHAESFFTQTKN